MSAWVSPWWGDIHPGNDSLGGLHTAVASAAGSHVFVVGCDMPLLQPALIYGLAGLVDDWDVVVPIKNDYPEPLCAFYGKKCAPHIESSISRGRLKMIGFHEQVRVRRVEEAAWRAWDPEGASFPEREHARRIRENKNHLYEGRA